MSKHPDDENPEENDPSESIQSKGGKARDKSLSSERKSEIARAAARARWTQEGGDGAMPEAIKDGFLVIGDVKIECYVLNNLKRVIHKRGMAKALGMKSSGGNAFMKTMSRKGLGSGISPEVQRIMDNPIIFKPLNGDPGHGYESTFLIDICNSIIDAQKAQQLHPNQYHLYVQAEIIVRAAAKVGITALIDEATGFIADKRKEEYRELFREFIREEFNKYESEFPDKFFDMIYKIYGLKRSEIKNRHPQFFGKFIRKYIYQPLANSNGAILQLLDEKNPVVYASGGRKYKMFQFLTDVVGLPSLRAHLWQIVGIGSTCNTKDQFERRFKNAFPEPGDQNEFDLELD